MSASPHGIDPTRAARPRMPERRPVVVWGVVGGLVFGLSGSSAAAVLLWLGPGGLIVQLPAVVAAAWVVARLQRSGSRVALPASWSLATMAGSIGGFVLAAIVVLVLEASPLGRFETLISAIALAMLAAAVGAGVAQAALLRRMGSETTGRQLVRATILTHGVALTLHLALALVVLLDRFIVDDDGLISRPVEELFSAVALLSSFVYPVGALLVLIGWVPSGSRPAFIVGLAVLGAPLSITLLIIGGFGGEAFFLVMVVLAGLVSVFPGLALAGVVAGTSREAKARPGLGT